MVYAIGRNADTPGLRLEAAGLKANALGKFVTDDEVGREGGREGGKEGGREERTCLPPPPFSPSLLFKGGAWKGGGG